MGLRPPFVYHKRQAMSTYVFFTFSAFLLYFQAALYFLLVLPSTRVNRSFVATSLALAWMSLFLFLFHLTDQPRLVYLYDRMAVFGWALFPWLASLLVFYLSQNQQKWIGRTLHFFLPLMVMAMIIRYQYHPESLKFFYRHASGIWYFSAYNQSVWVIVASLYNLICALLSIHMSWKWTNTTWLGTNNKKKLQSLIVLITLLLFTTLALLSNLIIPLLGSSSMPPLVHLAAIPLIAGLFFPLVLLNPETYLWKSISSLFIRRIHQLVMFLDHNTTVDSVNRHGLKLLGRTHSQMVDSDPALYFSDGETLRSQLSRAATNMPTKPLDCDLLPLNAPAIPVSLSVVKVNDSFRNIVGFVIVATDRSKKEALCVQVAERIRMERELRTLQKNLEKRVETRRRELLETNDLLKNEMWRREKAEEQLLADMQKKEGLLREIHHRVKNSIQITVSLINMSFCELSGTQPDAVLHSLFGQRLRDISFIHEYLYDSPYIGKIKFSHFIVKATNELRGLQLSARDVFFRVQLEEEELSINQAIPCGIIFYELLANSLKFAFPDGKNNFRPANGRREIRVAFYRKNGLFFLEVQDNGAGLTMINGMPEKKGVGLRLVEKLVNDDLGGRVSYRVKEGTLAIVEFGNKEPGNKEQ